MYTNQYNLCCQVQYNIYHVCLKNQYLVYGIFGNKASIIHSVYLNVHQHKIKKNIFALTSWFHYKLIFFKLKYLILIYLDKVMQSIFIGIDEINIFQLDFIIFLFLSWVLISFYFIVVHFLDSLYLDIYWLFSIHNILYHQTSFLTVLCFYLFFHQSTLVQMLFWHHLLTINHVNLFFLNSDYLYFL